MQKMNKLLLALEEDTLTVPETVEVFEDLNDNYGESAALEEYHKHYRRVVRPGLEFNEQYLALGGAAILGAAAIAAAIAITKIIKKVIDWFKGGGGDTVESMGDVDQAIKSNHFDNKFVEAAKDIVKDAKATTTAAKSNTDDKKDGKQPESWETFRDEFYEKNCSSPYLRLWLVFDDMASRYDKAATDLNHCNATLKKFETAIGHAIKTIVTEESYKQAEQDETFHSARGLMADKDAVALDTLNLDAYFPVTEGKPASKWMTIEHAPVAAAELIGAISKVQKHYAIDFDEVQKMFEELEKKQKELLERKVTDKDSPEFFQAKAAITAHQTAVRVMSKYIQEVMKMRAFTQGAIRFSNLFLKHFCAYMDRLGVSSSTDSLRRMEGLLKELETTILDRIKHKGS